MTFLPNQLVCNFQVTAKDKDPASVRKSNDEKVRKVLAALKAAGVEPQEIVLADTGIVPDYRGNEIVAQIAMRNFTLTLNQLARIDPVLTAAVRAGAVPIGPVVLRNSDQRAWEEKARISAATAARVRGTAIVEALGGKLGLPRAVTDQTNPGQAQVSGYFVASPEGQVVTAFAATELAVMGQVNVQFDIRDDG